jgi:hypothetical protein
MPTPTYTALANLTLGSASATVTFSNIPQTYKDLVLVMNRASGTIAESLLRFNADATSNYPQNWMLESGGQGTGGGTYTALTFGATNTGSAIINILDYSSTDKHKVTLTRWHETGAMTIVQLRYTGWRNLAGITSLDLSLTSGTYPAGVTFALYGIVS